jgi:hypothetical protein
VVPFFEKELAMSRLFKSVVAAAAAVVVLLLGTVSRADVIDVTSAATMPVARMKVVYRNGYAANMTVNIQNASGPVATVTMTGGFLNVAPITVTNPAGGSDSGKITHVGADLVVDLQLFSLVLSAVNQCAPSATAPAVDSYTITMSGGGAPSAVGLAGYSAASETNCSCATRRKGTGIAWHGGTAPFTEQRIPFNTMLVLDESGSMLSTPGGGANKWALLVSAVDELGATLNMESTVPDTLGAVFFDNLINPFSSGGTAWIAKTATPSPPFGPLMTEVNDPTKHPHAGSTSVGGAMKSALEQAACLTDPIADPMILLLSDGMQNTAPMVDDGSGADLGFKVLSYASTCGSPAALQRLSTPCIPVLSVYIDLPAAGDGASLLQAIADQTAGNSAAPVQLCNDPVQCPTMGSAVGGKLVSMLKGSTMSFLAKSVATMPANVSSTSPITFNVDGTVKRLVVLLGWEPLNGNQNALTLTGTPPGGNNTGTARAVTRGRSVLFATAGNNRSQQGNFYIASGLDLPTNGVGTWTVQVQRTNTMGVSQSRAIPYHLFVYAVEGQLEFIPRFTPGRHATGDPLVMNLDLGLARVPVTGQGSSIKVSVDGPTGAIGTILHNFKDPGGSPTPGETDNPADKKLQDLKQQNADLLKQTLPQSTGQVLTFNDLGGGRYQVTLSGNTTHVPGDYVFHMAVDLNGPSGAIHRVEDLDTMVEVKPDPVATGISVSPNTGGIGSVTVVPIDKFNNFLGPGFEPSVKVKILSGGGTVMPAVDTKVDGTYTVQLTGLAPGSDPQVSVAVAGTPVAQGPLSQLPQPGTRCTGGNSGGGGCSGCMGKGGGVVCFPAAGLVVAGLLRRRRRQA